MADAAFQPELFARLEQLEERSFWFRERTQLILWALRKYFPFARTFCEAGCGTGIVLEAVAAQGLEVTGVELYPEGATIARRRVPEATIVVGDAGDLSGRWDVAGCFDVLEHVDDDAAFLQGLREVADGLILTVPQHPRLWTDADAAVGHRRRYIRRELVASLRAAGWEPELATSFVMLLAPAALLARRDGDPLRGLVPPEPLNALCRLLLAGERQLIRAGVTLPVGSSLLVVAR
jgi:hypothetical protein